MVLSTQNALGNEINPENIEIEIKKKLALRQSRHALSN